MRASLISTIPIKQNHRQQQDVECCTRSMRQAARREKADTHCSSMHDVVKFTLVGYGSFSFISVDRQEIF